MKVNGVLKEHIYERVIPPNLFEECEKIRKNRGYFCKSKRNKLLVYQKCLRCPSCGHFLSGYIKKKKYTYYRCVFRHCRSKKIYSGFDLNKCITNYLKIVATFPESLFNALNYYLDENEKYLNTLEKNRIYKIKKQKEKLLKIKGELLLKDLESNCKNDINLALNAVSSRLFKIESKIEKVLERFILIELVSILPRYIGETYIYLEDEKEAETANYLKKILIYRFFHHVTAN